VTTTLFWDIDGTLITTGKAGVPAWEAAVLEVAGREFHLSSIRVPGLTDYQIAVRTFEMLGITPDETLIRRLVQRYESLLPEYLPLRQGRVLPNVREILEALHGRDDVRSYLLTGNTRAGARAKLSHYGIFHFFPDGAFAEVIGNAVDRLGHEGSDRDEHQRDRRELHPHEPRVFRVGQYRCKA